MKNNFDIKVNPPKLGSSDINKHKNFDALLSQFEQAGGAQGGREVPLPTGSRFFGKYIVGGSLAIAASIALIFVFRGLFNGGDSQSEVLALDTPFDKVEKAYSKFELTAEKGDTIHYSSGSSIIVPAAAFVDKTGKPVNGKVDIEYREFDDPVDMFLAGVPQKTADQHLQTAGIMQIQGFKDGEPVYISKDHKLQMELKSTVPADMPLEELKVYAYTADEKDWKYKMNDKVEILNEIGKLENPNDTTLNPNGNPSLESARATILAKLERQHPKPIRPIEPSRGIGADMTPLSIEIDLNDYPELSQYNEIIWVAKKAVVDPMPESGWGDVKFNRIGELKYEVTMIPNAKAQKEGLKEFTYEAYPLVKYSRQAQDRYEKEIKEYNQIVSERDIKIAESMKNWQKANGYFGNNNNPQNNNDDQIALRQIINRFEIAAFGLWNCANPVSLDGIPTLNAEFAAAEGEMVAVQDIFVADQKRHLYYSSKSDESLHFDTNNEHAQLWVMDDKQQLWVATPNPAKEGDHTRFTLQPAADIRSEADVRRVLVF